MRANTIIMVGVLNFDKSKFSQEDKDELETEEWLNIGNQSYFWCGVDDKVFGIESETIDQYEENVVFDISILQKELDQVRQVFNKKGWIGEPEVIIASGFD